MILKILIVLFLKSVICDQVNFEGYKVFEVFPKTEHDLLNLTKWEHIQGIDFWRQPNLLEPLQAMISPDMVTEFLSGLEIENIKYTLRIENFERILEVERKQQALGRLNLGRTGFNGIKKFGFSHFYDTNEINDYVEYLCVKYPNIVQVETVGQSGEGRRIKAVKISANGNVDGKRPIIFVDAGTHAREWAAHMSAVVLMHTLVEQSQNNLELLNKLDWIVIPNVNPDGYHYSQKINRMWRKNRRIFSQTACVGVDLNRNYGYKWRKDTNNCFEDHSGPAAFSEPETTAVKNVLEKYKTSIKLYLSLHAYGNWVLFPWGYDRIPIDNWKEHDKVGKLFASSILEASQSKYIVGNSAMLLYPAAGGSDDYAASVGVNLAYTIEVTKGTSGFVMPASEIKGVGDEVFAGCRAAALYLTNNKTLNKSSELE